MFLFNIIALTAMVIGLVWLIFVFIVVRDFETRITITLMIFMELLAIPYATNIILGGK